ncbi:MAG: ComEC/Rec2 family competence protein [Micropepsaceae bacterium]
MPQGPPAAIAEIEAERRRRDRALWAPVALGTGALAYLLMTAEPPGWTGWAAGAGALALLILAARAGAAVAAAGLLLAGFALAVLRAETAGTPVLQGATRDVEVTGRVVETIGHPDGRARLLIDVAAIAGIAPEATPRRIRIAMRKADERLAPGTAIAVRARLTPLPLPVAPGAYDFARAAWFGGIGGYGFATGAPRAVVAEAPGLITRTAIWIAQTRDDASRRIHEALPGATGAIAAALTVGDRSQIPEADDEAMRDSSLAHVLSISGLHMTIIGLGAFASLRFLIALWPWLVLRIDARKWAASVAIVLAGGYLALSGASVPAQRSFLMIALVFLAILADRAPYTLRIVAISALVILAIAPESVVDPSFQMSFAAVTALVAAYQWVQEAEAKRGAPFILRDSLRGRVVYVLASALLASVVAGLATAPFAAFHFNRVAVYGVIANIAAMPVITFVIMPMAGLTLVALPLGIEGPFLAVMGWGIDAMLWIARETASWPGASGRVPTPPDYALGLTTLGGLWLCLTRGRARALGLAPIVLALASPLTMSVPDVLIDRDAKNVAVRDADGMLTVVSGRRAKFTAEEWLERDGDPRDVAASARAGRAGIWVCDDGLCSADAGGRRVVYMERKADGRIACGQGAAVVIAARRIDPCAEGLTVTPEDTARLGAMNVRFEGEEIITDTVRDRIGVRRWTVWGKEPPPPAAPAPPP